MPTMHLRPHWGSLQRSPDPLAGKGGGREGEGREKGKIVATRCQILRLKCEDVLYKCTDLLTYLHQ